MGRQERALDAAAEKARADAAFAKLEAVKVLPCTPTRRIHLEPETTEDPTPKPRSRPHPAISFSGIGFVV